MFFFVVVDVPVDALFSTLVRTAARTLETKLFVDSMQGWFDDLVVNIKVGDTKTFNETQWDPSSWPSEARGVGYRRHLVERLHTGL